MYFCNVHLTGGVVADPAAQVLAQLLREELDDYPVVLVGDFNAFPISHDEYPTSPEWLARGRSRVYDTLTATLVDVHKVLHPYSQRASYCGWEPSCEDYDIGDLRLDWILHSPVFTPMSAEILVRRRDGRNVSDHWPVEAVVTITPSNSP
jgi:endonuclease/exonuclease/phosphatase family metal-dependent hydrolase